jgi:cytochrome c-type biogenesis protein CcmF
MVTHPPALYLGFVGTTVPYAFGMAALFSGRLDETWLTSIRRWILVSWFFLSMGLVLGMIWAYEELDWGGVWGWDAVENAGLIPWLTATALLHSIMIQERRGMLKVWNLTLVILTFFLTIVGTFFTRSGVVRSVHAFGQDPRLAVIFGVFMAIILGVSFGLMARRRLLLRSRPRLDSLLSRETAFLLNNWVLLFAAFFVLGATLWPTLTELLSHERATMSAPFFNRWMAPIGLVLLGLTGVCPLLSWRRASVGPLLRQLIFPVLVGLGVLTAAILWDRSHGLAWVARWRAVGIAPLLCFVLSGFVLGTIAQELWRGAGVRGRSLGVGRLTALIGLVAKSKRRYGGYTVHAGMVFVFLGLAGGAFKHEIEAALSKGQKVEFVGLSFTLEEVGKRSDNQKEMLTAHLLVTERGRPVRRMVPAKWTYHKHEEAETKVDIWRQPLRDVWISLSGLDEPSGRVMLKLVSNPLMSWLWFGFVLLTLGFAIAILPERVLGRAVAAARASPPRTKERGAAAVLLFAALFASAPAFAEAPAEKLDHSQKAEIVVRSEVEQRLLRRLVCMCSTCPRLPLSECGCGYADKERRRIAHLLNVEHKTEAEVVAAFVAQYGQAALAVPQTGLAGHAWIILYAVGALAVGAVVLVAWRWSRRRTGGGRAAADGGPGPDDAPDDADADAAGKGGADRAGGADGDGDGDERYREALERELKELD